MKKFFNLSVLFSLFHAIIISVLFYYLLHYIFNNLNEEVIRMLTVTFGVSLFMINMYKLFFYNKEKENKDE